MTLLGLVVLVTAVAVIMYISSGHGPNIASSKDILSPQNRSSTKGMRSHAYKRTKKFDTTKLLVLLGGESDRKDNIVNGVEVISPNSSLICNLPPLPKSLKWGCAGYLSRHLVVCGGQTGKRNPSLGCWALDPLKRLWTNFRNLTR